jgi:transposase
MFVLKILSNNKKSVSYFIAESYRDKNRKPQHRIISNISKLPLSLIENIKILLKGKKLIDGAFKIQRSKPYGAIKTIFEIAKRIGITKALGDSQHAMYALLQIAGRIVNQQSRNFIANEWVNNQSIEEVFGLKDFTEDTLYANLKWLSNNQNEIEKKLFNIRSKNTQIKEVFLYDVTSSYLEGTKNELADYGYNRDGKNGKMQIVIGLLTDKDGYPVSVEVFKGNTSDMTTVENQLLKLKNNFGVERVVLVGDKGMIKSAQIEQIKSDIFKWNFLTSITKEQIKTLIKKNIVQLSLFEDDLVEVTDDDIRYILRRNPARSLEISQNRKLRIEKIENFVVSQNKYLKEHPKAKATVALKRVNEKISAYKLKSIITSKLENDNIQIEIDKDELEKSAELDGCYALKTDLKSEEMSKETAHARYKDLSKVEDAFRTMKTYLEQMRPIYVRKEETTRGHVFVAMLAYIIIKYIVNELKDLDYTKDHIFESLNSINLITAKVGEEEIKCLPDDLEKHQEAIIKRLGIKLL